jgi:hypothetical protein
MEEKETFRQILESPAYEQQNELLNKLINKNKVEIDRSVFKKTPEEKVLLSVLKSEWKRKQAMKGY